MRRALVLSLLLVGVPASAQSAPTVTALRGPLAFHGRVESSGETSCSQSWATSRIAIDVTLAVTASGAATLTAESLDRETFGDAATRYTGGVPGLTQTLSRRILTGRATRTRTAIDVRFDHAEDVSMRWTGEGVGTLPATTTPQTVTLGLHCDLAPVDVLPGAPGVMGAVEPTTSVSLLRCPFDAAPGFVEHVETHELVLGSGPGVRLVSIRDAWRPQGTTAVRFSE